MKPKSNSRVVRARMSEIEYEKIEDSATKAGITVSEWMRWAARTILSFQCEGLCAVPKKERLRGGK